MRREEPERRGLRLPAQGVEKPSQILPSFALSRINRRRKLSHRHAPIGACRRSTIPSTTGRRSSPIAATSASIARRSTSPPYWPDRSLESRKSMTAFGSSASCTMIWDISTWNRGLCKPSTTRSARGCHPCVRYVLLPMSSVWTMRKLERAKGFEPSTPTLARLCSTPELHPLKSAPVRGSK